MSCLPCYFRNTPMSDEAKLWTGSYTFATFGFALVVIGIVGLVLYAKLNLPMGKSIFLDPFTYLAIPSMTSIGISLIPFVTALLLACNTQSCARCLIG